MLRKALLATLLVAGFAAGPTIPASGAEPDPAATYELGDPATVEARFNYGQGRGDSIPIGVDTRRVIIEPTETEATGFLRGPVTCTIYGAHSDSVQDAGDKVPLGGSTSRSWTTQEWADPAARFLDLPEGTIAVWPNREADDYDRFDLYCDAYQQSAARQVTRLLWRMTPYEHVAPVVTLVEDPALRFADDVTSRYADGGPTRILSTGQEVRVVGPAGTWPVNGAATGLAGNVEVQLVTTADYRVLQSAVSDDRSTLTFVLPDLATSPDPDEAAYLTIVSNGSESAGGHAVARRVYWQAPVVVNLAGIAQSHTTLTVPRYLLRWWRPTATVVVERADGTPAGSPWGSVRILIDGEQYGPDVAVDTQGRAGVRLPYLEPGRHLVAAWYRGDSATAPSFSPEVRVRVLF